MRAGGVDAKRPPHLRLPTRANYFNQSKNASRSISQYGVFAIRVPHKMMASLDAQNQETALFESLDNLLSRQGWKMGH